MTYEALIEQQNRKIEKSYLQSVEIVKSLWEKLQDDKTKYGEYLFLIADKILYFNELENEITDKYYLQNSLQQLQQDNLEFFREILPENYEESFANPEYAVKIFGEKIGAALSVYYSSYRNYVVFAFQHQRYLMEKWNKLFIAVHHLLTAGGFKSEELVKLTASIHTTPMLEDSLLYFQQNYNKESLLYKNIVTKADLNDIRYLFQYGRHITENEIHTAEFLKNYSREKIDLLADAITKAFIRGYDLAKKDISSKRSIGIYYNLGQERIVLALINKLSDRGLTAILSNPFTTPPNKQYQYDHRFDNALFLDENLVDSLQKVQAEAAEKCSHFLTEFAGSIYFDAFGKKPFAPVSKPACLKLSKEQQQLSQKQRMNFNQIFENYVPRSKTSFCIVGFPTPEIGRDFESIFEETIGINMMDTIEHESIQQHIVDALDKADFVQVKGRNDNLTDIKVKMHKLTDPARQTNFVNCGADVNIPVGEVFTSPMLKGTNGVLHLKETFLKDLRFIDLKLTFQDGYVTEYSCRNFGSREDNSKFIEENLFFPHKTLPVGEFAIGTNTKAYMMAKKFDILPVLPVLIVEKMGPHFAIGDTCFSWEEDFAVFNSIDNKEIIARENERSALRKVDVAKAYTNCHIDITLPYEDLDFITAVCENQEKIDIIRDGRFVVPGTGQLNIPLDEYAGIKK